MKLKCLIFTTLLFTTPILVYGGQVPAPGIINGQPANPAEFPFYVALNQYGNMEGHRCGGVLINKRWMLTAAHCNAAPLLHHDVLIGLKRYAPEVEFYERATPEKIIIHKDYRYPDTDNTNSDLALIKFTKDVQSIHFAKLDGINDNVDLSVGKELTVVGFGLTETERNTPEMLRTQVTIFDSANCINLPAGYPPTKFNPKLSLCAGNINGGAGNGDSGGPLMARNNSGEYIVVGLVSRDLKRPYEQWPKIAAFKTWITTTIQNN